jgi:uncharacterized membrane protein YfcA
VGDLDAVELVLFAVVAVVTSAITAVSGLGGGIILLAVMLLVLDPLVAIPLHAAIQLASNSTRALRLSDDVEWPYALRFALPLLPAGYLGLALASSIPADAGRAVIGVFALVATWRPSLLSLGGDRPVPPTGFYLVGAVAGVLNMSLGATGPAVAPVFRRATSGRMAFVATFAAAQVAGHLAKLVVFGLDGFAYLDWIVVLAVGSAAVAVGTVIGTTWLRRMSEQLFQAVFRVALTVVAAQLIYTAVV